MEAIMISDREKFWVHEYARAAGLKDQTRRALLRAHARVSSAADPAMTQQGFESVMAALETVLFERVDAGEIPNPIGRSKYIHSRTHWRRKLDLNTPGRVNSRQYHLMMQLWAQLGEWMSDDQRTPEYFAGIVARATRKTDIGVSALSSSQAWCVIEALKSRLSNSIKSANKPEFIAPF
jgi:hypothetical protein